MKIAQVTFVAKNEKCVSLDIRRYLIITDDKVDALDEATELLREGKDFDLYKAMPVLLVDAHYVRKG